MLFQVIAIFESKKSMGRGLLLFFLFLIGFNSCISEYEQLKALAKLPFYSGEDLGLTYSPEKSSFRIWSPDAETMMINLYEDDLESEPYLIENMNRDSLGTWLFEFEGDLEGKYYTFQSFFNEGWSSAVPDPYAKAVGRNGKRAMVVDFSKTNPEGYAAH